jgi:Tfp pilus assembly protein PilN
MFWFYMFIAMVFLLGFQLGSIRTLRSCTAKLKEANDLLELQNKTLTERNNTIDEFRRRDDGADYWKPKDWRDDWEPGDA